MATTLTDMQPPGVTFPRKNYGWYGSTSSIPATIAEANIRYTDSTKLPFYVLR
jgi:hypothetical protein